MKKNFIYLLLQIFFLQQCLAQGSDSCMQSFTVGPSFSDFKDVVQIWTDSTGSHSYLESKHPYRVINAKVDLGLKADDANYNTNDVLFRDGVLRIKDKHETDMLVIYFPPGVYTFFKPINLKDITDVILKGESAKNSFLVAPHPGAAIILNNCQRVGIEDVSVSRWTNIPQGDNESSGEGCNINITNSRDCWVSGVWSYYPRANHIHLAGGSNGDAVRNITITGCTFNEAELYGGNNQGYGVNFNGAKYCRLENSVFHELRHAISFQQDASFNVVAYNASFGRRNENGKVDPDDPTRPEFIYDYVADLSFHGRFTTPLGPRYNLIEGNRLELVMFDRVHGSNGPYNTFLRNYIDAQMTVSTFCSDIFPNCEYIPNTRTYYPYDSASQVTQNIIGSRVGYGNLIGFTGTKVYNGNGSGTAHLNLSACTKSYFSVEKPTYLPDEVWPLVPRTSKVDDNPAAQNAAERRRVPYSPETIDAEGYDKYPCGLLADVVVLESNQVLINDKIRAQKTIYAAQCTAYPGPFFGPDRIDIGTVEFTATDTIVFLPGFSTAEGVRFSALPEPVSCDGQRPMNRQSRVFNEPAKRNVVATDDSATRSSLIGVAPNPFNQALQLDVRMQSPETVTVVLYNLLAQPVFTHSKRLDEGSQSLLLDAESVPAGIYILQCRIGENYLKSIKITKHE